MNYREMVERHLVQADRHVAVGERNVARQREIVESLMRGSHPKALIAAWALLATFEDLLVLQIAHRGYFRVELALLSKLEPPSAN